MIEENHKELIQIGRYRDLNQGPPEYESSVLALPHPARQTSIVNQDNIIIEN